MSYVIKNVSDAYTDEEIEDLDLEPVDLVICVAQFILFADTSWGWHFTPATMDVFQSHLEVRKEINRLNGGEWVLK